MNHEIQAELDRQVEVRRNDALAQMILLVKREQYLAQKALMDELGVTDEDIEIDMEAVEAEARERLGMEPAGEVNATAEGVDEAELGEERADAEINGALGGDEDEDVDEDAAEAFQRRLEIKKAREQGTGDGDQNSTSVTRRKKGGAAKKKK